MVVDTLPEKIACLRYSDFLMESVLHFSSKSCRSSLVSLVLTMHPTVDNLMKGKTRNPKLKTLHKLAIGLDMTVFQLLDFPEMNEIAFDDE